MPHLLLFAMVILVTIAFVAAVLLKQRAGGLVGEGDTGPVFQLEFRPYFFSVAENKFFGVLEEASSGLGLRVFPKVGLNDLFKDKPGADRGQYYRYASMHVDYLLVPSVPR